MNLRISLEFARVSWEDSTHVEKYEEAVTTVGLWESERRLVRRAFPEDARLLDVGCGAGRTTFALLEEGYRNITGCDFSKVMVDSARRIAHRRGAKVEFDVADVTALPYADASFSGALFSAQGLMCIPGSDRRQAALGELRRVLSPGGVLIFSTHDRCSGAFAEYWRAEKTRWELGEQDPRLLEYGDRIIDDAGRPTFFHVPSRTQVRELIAGAGLDLIDEAARVAIAQESAAVCRFTPECRFWVARRSQLGRPEPGTAGRL